MAATPSPPANSGALGERDLFRGSLDVGKLLVAFQAFYREHSEHWLGRFDYREAGPQLLLQAFLQRVVNGGGRIEREYGSPLAKQALERIGALHRIAPRAAMQARPAQFITGTKPEKIETRPWKNTGVRVTE